MNKASEALEIAGRGVVLPAVSHEAQSVLLRARALSKAFGGNLVLKSVDVELARGEVVLLSGENGSGKTTLLNILSGNLEPDRGEIVFCNGLRAETYEFPRAWWKDFNPLDHFTPEYVAARGIGRTWQDIRLFGSLTLRENIQVATPGNRREALAASLLPETLIARPESASASSADARLARLGLAGREASSADRISLGQSKRVAIARAIAAGARILFLDEPLAGLDQDGIQDVLEYLEELVRDDSVTLVIVEHVFNQRYLRPIVTTDWRLVDGQVRLTRVPQMVSRTPSRSSALEAGSGSAARPAWFRYLAQEHASVTDEALPHGGMLTRIREGSRDAKELQPLLQIENLVIRRGPRTVIGLPERDERAGFSLALYAGEVAILQAPNGWGKSTLLAAIMGIVRIESGTIRFQGRNIERLPVWKRVRLGISALLGDSNTFATLDAREMARLAGMDGHLPASHAAGRPISSFSGGERQSLALDCLRPGVIKLCDEPFSGLDENSVRVRCNLLACAEGRSVLILVPYSNQNSNAR